MQSEVIRLAREDRKDGNDAGVVVVDDDAGVLVLCIV